MVEALSQLVTTLFAPLTVVSTGTGGTVYSGGVIPYVFHWLTSTNVLPFFAIGIGCSLALFGVKVIRSVVWGS